MALSVCSVDGLAATAIDAELEFIKSAIDGKVGGWDILSDVVGGAGFKALLNNPEAMKLAVNSDAMKVMSVYPAFDSLTEAVNSGASTEAVRPPPPPPRGGRDPQQQQQQQALTGRLPACLPASSSAGGAGGGGPRPHRQPGRPRYHPHGQASSRRQQQRR